MAIEKVKITGLYESVDGNGDVFLTGKLNGISRVLVMPNDYKRDKKDADYLLYVVSNNYRDQREEEEITQEIKQQTKQGNLFR